MKILIVSGSGVIFRILAKELHSGISKFCAVELAVETGGVSPVHLLRQRIRRSGFVRGIDQFAFKVFDLLCLRRRQERAAHALWTPGNVATSVRSINSADGLEYLRAGKFEAVICIGTSIVGQEALTIPDKGFINIHPGILPNYRGAGNFWAVVNQDWNHIGCSVHWMTEKIDAGKIIAVEQIHEAPSDLWALHVMTLRRGVQALVRIIQSDSLLDTSAEVHDSPNRYYGWYGFLDYWRFKKALKKWRNR